MESPTYACEPPIYLDNASTSHPKPAAVLEGMARYLAEIGASPGRGGYRLARAADDVADQARAAVAEELGGVDPDSIGFTHNATHALNAILKGYLKERNHVIVTNFEHNAVLRPLHALNERRAVSYSIWESDANGQFDRSELEAMIRPETRLLAANHASNVIGVVSPVAMIAEVGRQHQIPTLIDVSQTAGLLPIDAAAHGFDFIAGTGHKSLLGPPGVGFLYARDPELIEPTVEGGGGPNSASPVHPQLSPAKFEAGTANYLGICGLLCGIGFIRQVGRSNLLAHELELTGCALEQLGQIDGVTIYGRQRLDAKVPVISFNIAGYLSAEVAHILDGHGICTRPGLQCAPLIHKTIGTNPHGTVRVSFGHRNNNDHLEKLLAVVRRIAAGKKV